ncbi:MAG TPA: hypothetical protein VM937_06615 [Burkholderiaceae bacterium]|nr:hypothetical protein [Burkholderiaceae bacterium]
MLSTALHVVPQLLRDWVDPAWSMLVLMVADACAVALVVRSRTALAIGLLLAALLGAAVLSHQQVLAALPSIALNLMLASVFGVTLRPRETPLIVRIAELDQGALSPQFARYLRALTQAWALFFTAMAVLSLLLMLYAPFESWSLFVNVLTWPLIGVMFAVEWIVRRVGFKELPPHTPLDIATKVFAYQRQVAMRIGPHTG